MNLLLVLKTGLIDKYSIDAYYYDGFIIVH